MSTKANRFRLVIPLALLCFLLSGCTGSVDENILSKPADYSINISLPYATVTPPPSVGNQEAALVIDAEGSVTVNDSASILQNNVADTDEDESNYKSLSLGNTGLAVQALQTRLAELGYFTEGVSGIFDAATETAVRRFEQTYGTMQTGVATAKLQARLFSASAPVYGSDAYTQAVVSQYSILQRGDVGSSVYALQQRLKNLGYPISELSGAFDNETANAVMLFYESYGLTASDVANVAMQMELYSDGARLYAQDGKQQQSVSSNEVMALQNRLLQLGFYSGTVDGDYGVKTQTAVKLFEEACGRLPSGELNSTLKALLDSEIAPRFKDFSKQYSNILEGSSGESVRLLQERLVALGFATGTPNGEYGSATTASVKLFQQKNGLDQTGVANTYTQAVLYSSFALNIDGKSLAATAPISDAVADEESESDIHMDETLVLGSTGSDVYRLQQRLISLGYVSSLTGSYDNLTSRAVSAIQQDIGLEPTGTADGNLLLFIYSTAAPDSGMPFFDQTRSPRQLALGDSGDDVVTLQKRLWELGLLTKESIADSVGSFNAATQTAVEHVQTALEYEIVNGVASPALQCYLYSNRCTAESFAVSE